MTMRGLGLASVVAAAIWGVAAPAQAAEVMCSSDLGECTVSNDDGVDSASCDCAEGEGFGTSGGDRYEGLSEDELQEICEGLLLDCKGGPDTDPGTSTTASDTSATDTDATSTTAGTDPTGETGTTGPADDTAGSDETAGTTAADSESSGASAEDASASAEDASASAEDASASAEDASATDAEESSEGDGGADDEDDSGCSCDASGRDRSGLLGLGLLGVLGLRARRRRA